MAAQENKLDSDQQDSDLASFSGFESDEAEAKNDAVTGLDDKDSDEEALERLVLGNAAGFRDKLFSHDDELDGSDSGDEDLEGADADGKDDELEDVADADLFVIDTAPAAGAAAGVLTPASRVNTSMDEGRGGEVAMWEDSDDEALSVSLMSASRLRKLRTSEAEDVISGGEFCRRLRRHYLRLHPTPAWARQADGRRAKRRRRSSASAASDSSNTGATDDAADDVQQHRPLLDDFLRDANRLAGVGVSRRPRALRPEVISIQRTREIPDRHRQPVETLSFHPEYPVLLSTSAVSVLFLHHVAPDAQPANPLLASVKATAAGVRNAQFLYPRGNRIVFAGRRRYFHSWDLPSGVVHKITRVLGHHLEHKSMERFRLSPCGRYMAIIATPRKGGGSVNVLDAATTQWIAEARLQSVNGIADVAWWSSGDGMTILGRDGLVGEYSMESRRFVGLWHDDGGIGAIVVALGGHSGSPDLGKDRWVAIGSNSGITNIYERSALLEPTHGDDDGRPAIRERPEPRRTLEQLVTPITVLAFSPDGQLLAFGSRNKKDALRLVHLPSFTIYRNWPTQQTPLGRITAVAFGRESNLLAVGNDSGRIRLWQIRN